jgi:preprotein translocase subunit SecY
MIGGFMATYNSGVGMIANIGSWLTNLLQNGWVYGILYFTLVVVFTYFYTAVTFDPKSISENVQKQGGYIPGIRPGKPTADFLTHLLNRITLVGALFLGIIAVLPQIVQGFTGITAFTVGGTSILIVVSVVLEVMKSVDAQISMYEY